MFTCSPVRAVEAGTNLLPLVVPDYFGDVAQRVARRIPNEHFLRLPLDNKVSSATWTNYLNSLDYERLYFTQSDIAEFRNHELLLDEALEDGDLSWAFATYERFRLRVAERVAWIDALLQQPFDLTVPETYHWHRKDAPWPVDAAEQDELWRKKVKNEYLRHHVRQLMASEEPPVYITRTNFLGYVLNMPLVQSAPPTAPETQVSKDFHKVQDQVLNNDAEWVMRSFLSAFTHAYDPHSDYLSLSDVEEFEIEMSLSLFGIGALLSSEDGAAEIVRLIPGGPADRDTRDVRLKPGDRIIAVAQEGGTPVDILHMPIKKVVRHIRGEKGTRVVLTVIPESDPSRSTTKTVDLVRDEVKLEDQAASWKLFESAATNETSRRIAVLTLPGFYQDMGEHEWNEEYRSSTRDVARLLGEMATQSVDGLILDLRDNGGGALEEAVNMTGLFIPTGPVVQVRQGRFMGRSFKDSNPAVAYAGPMIVLVSRLSASASEILAGALQDYGRALIVGDSKTHGKGSVQMIQPVSRDRRAGQVKVTNAAYYRISGRSVQFVGVGADILVPSAFDMMELGEEFLPHSLRCDPVAPDKFRPLEDLSDEAAVLRDLSLVRRASDGDWLAHDKVLQRVRAVQTQRELPLELTARRELAEMEKNVDEMTGRNETLWTVANDTNAPPHDWVLKETLSIMNDFVALRRSDGATTSIQAGGTAATATWTGRLRKNLWGSE